jgi:hypothetical protein
LRIDHVFANVVLDNLRDESVQGPSTGGGLLKDRGTFVVRIDRAFHRFDLAAHALESIH